jgi:hypothetical protein
MLIDADEIAALGWQVMVEKMQRLSRFTRRFILTR